MHFQKQDLDGTNFTWLKEGRKNIFTGQPSRRPFDPFNGDQVLFLINFYGSLSGQESLREGKAIEYNLRHHLPVDMQSEISVFNWMRSSPRLAVSILH